ncbi:MAG: BREX-3 system P-loop-containing protein BrxF [SAR324 cluster bacterium]|nr:BREX-3 system P-loop-containing protein BrxF [SAR324 cluster bacterium]
MAEPIESLLRRAITESAAIYHRLILLVGEPCSGKTETLTELSKAIGVSIINLNLSLSEQLLTLTPKKRSLKLPQIIDDIIRETGEIVILDNIEILFDTSLKQDSLRLLQKMSRNKTIVSSWSGKQDHSKLLYAEAGHPEYRTYDITDFLSVNMDGTNNFSQVIKPGEVEKA